MRENYTDFQIGNWVIDYPGGNYCTIKSISPNIVLQDPFSDKERTIGQIGKIKITKDKLQVLGFKIDYPFFIKQFNNQLDFIIVFLKPDIFRVCKNDEEICDVEFIHEVQNTFYAITGELLQGNLYGVKEV